MMAPAISQDRMSIATQHHATVASSHACLTSSEASSMCSSCPPAMPLVPLQKCLLLSHNLGKMRRIEFFLLANDCHADLVCARCLCAHIGSDMIFGIHLLGTMHALFLLTCSNVCLQGKQSEKQSSFINNVDFVKIVAFPLINKLCYIISNCCFIH